MRTGAAPSVPGSFLQSGEVFLQEHFVLAVLYVQLRACPVGVYGRAFPDFRKMFRAATKAAVLRSTGKTGTGVFPVSKNCCARKMGNVPSVPALLSENGERPVCPRFIVGKWGTSRLSPLYCRPRFIVVVPALLSRPRFIVPRFIVPALFSKCRVRKTSSGNENSSRSIYFNRRSFAVSSATNDALAPASSDGSLCARAIAFSRACLALPILLTAI